MSSHLDLYLSSPVELDPPREEVELAIRLRSHLSDKELWDYIAEKRRLARIQLAWGRSPDKYHAYVRSAILALYSLPR